MKRLHLLCNAHLDPYWLWEWEEGAAEVLSTFRTAADLCEEYDGFIFNHNEVILYKWVEEYEPELFARIQRLVKEGKWHIMGGWYLQPDCNMPSGESFVRQMLVGKNYFMEKFGVEPTTAINFDPFGHTRGLVQLLVKGGYDSYIHCRPDQNDCPLPDSDYVWVGYDGSTVDSYRTIGWYGTPRYGMVKEKIETYLKENSDREVGLVLWGVGNHGGGPSRGDLDDIKEIMEQASFPIIHSTPEAYFAERRKEMPSRPRHEGDLNAWAIGCYTSQVRLKQKHRLLENELYLVEKMASVAALQGIMDYPWEKIHEVLCDLLVGEFHDILPGSSIQPVEEAGIRLFDHALEILSRLKARAFFALASGQPVAQENQIPVLAYNPHPFVVKGIFQCEFNLPDSIFEEQHTVFVMRHNGKEIPCQVEKEASNLNLDWRKRCIFQAEFTPGVMNRFDCELVVLPRRPEPELKPENGKIHFRGKDIEAVISMETGLLESYTAGGKTYISGKGFIARVMQDNEDPWGMTFSSRREEIGCFELMTPEEGTRFSGLNGANVKEPVTLPSVRVIEDGPVRSVVEALFRYGDSFLVLHYYLPKTGSRIEVHARVLWNEKDKCLKLCVPVSLIEPDYMGEVAYGRDVLPGEKREVVAQKWTAAVDASHALTCINEGCYGSDFVDNEIRLTLLRSPAYSGHPVGDRPIVPQDRFTPRIDQGERQFHFWLQGGEREERLNAISREALALNEKPVILSFFPSGHGNIPQGGPVLSDDIVQITCLKRAEKENDAYVIRLFEPTGTARSTVLSFPAAGLKEEINLAPFEVKSFLFRKGGPLIEVDLLERPLNG